MKLELLEALEPQRLPLGFGVIASVAGQTFISDAMPIIGFISVIVGLASIVVGFCSALYNFRSARARSKESEASLAAAEIRTNRLRVLDGGIYGDIDKQSAERNKE